MLSSSSVPLHDLRRDDGVIIIYENQRCWLGRGFSAGGLLPNDRGRYSTPDGSQSWTTLEEAATAMTGFGWKVWVQEDEDNDDNDDQGNNDITTSSSSSRHKNNPFRLVDVIQKPYNNDETDDAATEKGEETDHENDNSSNNKTTPTKTNDNHHKKEDAVGRSGSGSGWWYARDFTPQAIQDASFDKRNTVLHWVRFRKWTQTIVFDPTVYCSDPTIYNCCNHVDSKAVQSLSKLLLHALTYMILVRENTTIMVVEEKEKQQSSQSSLSSKFKESTILQCKDHLLRDFVKKQQKLTPDIQDAFYQLDLFRAQLNTFVQEDRTAQKGLLRGLLLFSNTNALPDNLDQCVAEIPNFENKYCSQLNNNRYFSESERNAIATLVIKQLDATSFQLHCNQMNCNNCHYQWKPCPNSGCTDIMSQLYVSNHVEQECPYTLESCPVCGQTEIPRHGKAYHLTHLCPLRQATCPFQPIGCTTTVVAKDIGDHVTNGTSHHLLLAFHRMMEYQDTIRKLYQKCNVLERENAQFKEQLVKQQSTTTTALQSLNQSLNQLVLTKLHTMEKNHNREIKALQEQIRQLEKSHVKSTSKK